MTDRTTYEQYLVTQGLSTEGNFPCPHCKKKFPAFALASIDDLDGIPHEYACGMCVEDHYRSLISTAPVAITWDDVRSTRSRLLGQCDWTQMIDVPETTRNAWLDVRSQMRDITTDYPDPASAFAKLRQIESDNFQIT